MKRPGGSRSVVVIALVLALALLAAVALAACGGSSTPTPDPTPEPNPTPSEAAITPSPRWSPTMSPAAIPVVKPGQKPPPFSELKAMYAYDTSEPLDFKELPNLDDTVEGVRFHGIGFEHDGEGPFPVVVYAPGWKTPVMDLDSGWATEAAAMVKRGYAGLLLDEPSTRFYTLDAPTDIAHSSTRPRRAALSIFSPPCPRSTADASASSAGATAPFSAACSPGSRTASRPTSSSGSAG